MQPGRNSTVHKNFFPIAATFLMAVDERERMRVERVRIYLVV
jgi:hypothetical protein